MRKIDAHERVNALRTHRAKVTWPLLDVSNETLVDVSLICFAHDCVCRDLESVGRSDLMV